jgi:hypothetical protein
MPAPLLTATPQDNWIVFGSGYLQKMGDAQGIPQLAADFDHRYVPRGVRIEMRRWDDDWDDLAEWIFRRASAPENVRLLCLVYSWGAGFGFRQFAHSCRDRGIPIAGAVISDGVAHLGGRACHRIGLSQLAAYWPPPSACFRKLPRLRLHLPDNIAKDNTWWFVQQNSWLRGHNIYWEDTGQLAAQRELIQFRTHPYMDECPEFQSKALEVADRLFPSPPT